MTGNPNENEAFRKRLEATRRLLGKDQEIVKIDEETGEQVIVKKKYQGKPISHEDAQNLEYKALVSEGGTLYRAKEYRRAITAFTLAMDKQKEDQNILIDRANCYIQVGQPEDALKDIDVVLKNQPNNPRAILTKAEAYFSMGEFEFALVFFQRGISIRKDMSAFRDGITKCKSAILDSINGENLFQANPNYAVSRPRKALVEVPKDRQTEKDPEKEEAKLQATAALLPEKVTPLAASDEKEKYLGELQLDYDYLLELQEEVTNVQNEDEYSKKEDEQIAKIVADAILYLDQRGAFWCQQGGTKEAIHASPSQQCRLDSSSPNKSARTRGSKSGRSKSPTSSPQKGGRTQRTAHYEMSKIQQYEAKYGSPERKSRSPKSKE